MFVKMCFPFLSVEKLLHPRGSWKRRIFQAERAISRAGEGSAVDERIALDGKRVRPSQVEFAVIVPALLADNPLTAVETQLGKAVPGYELLLVAAIDMPPSLDGRFAMGKEPRQSLDVHTEVIQGEEITYLLSSSLWSAIRHVHFSGSKPGRKGTSASC